MQILEGKISFLGTVTQGTWQLERGTTSVHFQVAVGRHLSLDLLENVFSCLDQTHNKRRPDAILGHIKNQRWQF